MRATNTSNDPTTESRLSRDACTTSSRRPAAPGTALCASSWSPHRSPAASARETPSDAIRVRGVGRRIPRSSTSRSSSSSAPRSPLITGVSNSSSWSDRLERVEVPFKTDSRRSARNSGAIEPSDVTRPAGALAKVIEHVYRLIVHRDDPIGRPRGSPTFTSSSVTSPLPRRSERDENVKVRLALAEERPIDAVLQPLLESRPRSSRLSARCRNLSGSGVSRSIQRIELRPTRPTPVWANLRPRRPDLG